MSAAAIEGTNLIDLEQQAIRVQSDMASIQITDQASYNAAVTLRTEAKAWLKNVTENVFGPMKSTAHAAWKKVCDTEKAVCNPVENTVASVNRALISWDNEQEQLRRDEQRRQEAEAQRRAEEERLANAVQVEEAGADEATVAAVLDTPVQITAPVIAAPTYEKSTQVVYRDNWKGEVTSLLELVKFVAKNPSQIGLLQVNQTALNQMAKALKETMSIPGVRPINDKVVSSGRG